jgi:hypothetical protein
MTPSEAIAEAIEDIKSINRLLDPAGQAWADSEKRRRQPMMRCAGDYNSGCWPDLICHWSGPIDECETLNGEPICPICGSSVEEVKDEN